MLLGNGDKLKFKGIASYSLTKSLIHKDYASKYCNKIFYDKSCSGISCVDDVANITNYL